MSRGPKGLEAGELKNLMPERSKNPDGRSGIFFFLLGLVVCYFSFRIGLGRPSQPGPGFMPFLAGLLLASLSFLLVFQVQLRKMRATWPIAFRLKNVFIILIAMVGYGFLLDKIGFIFVTFLFVTFLIRLMEPQSWTKAILAGISASGASYLLFEILLKSQFPRSAFRAF
jgi:hypothetical protein